MCDAITNLWLHIHLHIHSCTFPSLLLQVKTVSIVFSLWHSHTGGFGAESGCFEQSSVSRVGVKEVFH